MTTTYLYIQFKIEDKDAFREYAQRVPETMKIYGGKMIAFNKSPIALHGELSSEACVLQEWPSVNAAKQWQDSPEYAPLKKLRDEKAMSKVKIIPIPAMQ
ncbi:hypothetical protein TW81_11135 [Vibrio galatheae]|uniref:DUF1330 domain-containing protein n=1 Tax=Vibrio galatheae TaxID=579748 RepID=A0A0F4NI03_9VIBR|nr:DUF1330 domain-containing protein [Vibrio galatheae]KJY82770.1 hypothetical protein TW81_11135 [Vibrio galatheae]